MRRSNQDALRGSAANRHYAVRLNEVLEPATEMSPLTQAAGRSLKAGGKMESQILRVQPDS